MKQPLTFEQQNEMSRRRYLKSETLTLDDAYNYFDKKREDSLREQGPIGLFEGLTKNNVSDFIPFANDIIDGIDTRKQRTLLIKPKR
jgi:hypothetical protein